jgi:hypothetical protein
LIPADALTRVLAGQDPDQPQAPPKPTLAPLQKFAADPLDGLTPALKRFVAAPLAGGNYPPLTPPGNYPDSFPTQALERFVANPLGGPATQIKLPPALERFAANPLGQRNYPPPGVFRRKQ